MSKWTHDVIGGTVRCDGKIIAHVYDEEIGGMIVREHNAHAELMILGDMYLERLETENRFRGRDLSGLIRKVDDTLARIRAEGGE